MRLSKKKKDPSRRQHPALMISLSLNCAFLALILHTIISSRSFRDILIYKVSDDAGAGAQHQASPSEESSVTVEDLMYKYRSDKSRDDHGYTKVYNMLFADRRLSIRNMTEVGIAAGQSVQAWYRYFPNAEIHAYDIKWVHPTVEKNLGLLAPRLHPHIVDILDPKFGNLSDLGLVEESMDIVIEDGPHTAVSQELFLQKLFPIVKPGGYYVIEDIGYKGIRNNGNARALFYEDPTKLMKETREILEAHETIFLSAAIGHRAWDEWLQKSGPLWAKDYQYHNSHLVVIQKREKPLRPKEMFVQEYAMNPKGIVQEDGS